MARKPSLEPRWLVGLLNSWAKRSLYSDSKGLGYPAICAMLKDGIPGRVRSYEPTGYGDADIKDVERAVNDLDTMRKLAVMRYFKPWMMNAIDQEVRRDADTWMYHLRQALDILRSDLDRKRPREHAAA